MNDLREMGGADFLFAFGDEDEIYGELFTGGANCVERGEKCRFRTLLVHGSAADEHFADVGAVDYGGVERGRRPFFGIELLDVVHEIEADGFGSACVERCEDA